MSISSCIIGQFVKLISDMLLLLLRRLKVSNRRSCLAGMKESLKNVYKCSSISRPMGSLDEEHAHHLSRINILLLSSPCLQTYSSSPFSASRQWRYLSKFSLKETATEMLSLMLRTTLELKDLAAAALVPVNFPQSTSSAQVKDSHATSTVMLPARNSLPTSMACQAALAECPSRESSASASRYSTIRLPSRQPR